MNETIVIYHGGCRDGFCAAWVVNRHFVEHYEYGMRSIGDFDVSTVAKLFGGGGHKNAAGFQLSYLLEELK